MKCSQCDSDARAVCRFCGLAVCRDHLQAARFGSMWVVPKEGLKSPHKEDHDVVVVENAAWCGRCTVRSYRHTIWYS